MPILSSAKKALRAGKKKRVYNLRRKSEIDSRSKAFRKLVAAKDKAGAEKALPSFYKALDKAAKTGFIKKNAAARLKSRAMAALKKLG
ncbi:MAG: 30S ribosomal protein S20 [Patescibacteria group bacterium]|nr:30S ribosomal protein S20 [Patescibacteria group bacterium]